MTGVAYSAVFLTKKIGCHAHSTTHPVGAVANSCSLHEWGDSSSRYGPTLHNIHLAPLNLMLN
jgi:hypothetical protein